MNKNICCWNFCIELSSLISRSNFYQPVPYPSGRAAGWLCLPSVVGFFQKGFSLDFSVLYLSSCMSTLKHSGSRRIWSSEALRLSMKTVAASWVPNFPVFSRGREGDMHKLEILMWAVQTYQGGNPWLHMQPSKRNPPTSQSLWKTGWQWDEVSTGTLEESSEASAGHSSVGAASRRWNPRRHRAFRQQVPSLLTALPQPPQAKVPNSFPSQTCLPSQNTKLGKN